METDHLLLYQDLHRAPSPVEMDANLTYLEEKVADTTASAAAALASKTAAEAAKVATEEAAAEANQDKLDAATSAAQALAAKTLAEQKANEAAETVDGLNGIRPDMLSTGAGKGTEMMRFKQSGTGAEEDRLTEVLQRDLNALSFVPSTERAAILAGTSTYDAAFAVQKAADEAKASKRRLYGVGKFRFGSTVNFREAAVDFERAQIDVAHAGIGILIGGNASSQNNPDQRFSEVLRSVGTDSTTTPTIRAIGVKCQNISVNRTTYLQVYADTTPAVNSTDYSSAYSIFNLKFVTTIELTNNVANVGAVQWINENQFFLGRCFNVLINGTYRHNHNKFYNGVFEGVASINLDNASDTWFYGARFEGGPTTLIFGTQSIRNNIEVTWRSSNWPSSIGSGVLFNGTVTDNGQYNQVHNRFEDLQHRSVIARASIDEPIFNNRVGLNNLRIPALQRITAASGSNTLVYSAMQPVVVGDVYEFRSDGADSGDTVLYRPALAFFDKNLKPVANATGFVNTGSMNSVTANVVTTGTGISATNSAISAAGAAGAKFVRAEWRSSNGQTANGLARVLELLRASMSVNLGRHDIAAPGMPPVVSAVPTQSFVPQGFQVSKSDGTALYICSFSLDTQTTAAEDGVATPTVIDVASATGVTNGDIVGVNLDNRDTHWTTVAGVSGTTITLTAGLPSAAASGARVVFNRWATK